MITMNKKVNISFDRIDNLSILVQIQDFFDNNDNFYLDTVSLDEIDMSILNNDEANIDEVFTLLNNIGVQRIVFNG